MISSIILIILNLLGKINAEENLGFLKWYFLGLAVEDVIYIRYWIRLMNGMTDEAFGLDELENASKRKLKETFSKVFSRPKEELKQEAKEYVCKRNPLVTKEWFIDALKKYDRGEKVKYLKDCEIAEYEAYIAGAEPREKQIDELKAQIKVLGQNLEDTEICENDLKNRIAELEEISTRLESYYQNQKVRIAELEAQIEKMKSDVKEEIGFAKNFDELHTYNVLNNLLNKWEIKEK